MSKLLEIRTNCLSTAQSGISPAMPIATLQRPFHTRSTVLSPQKSAYKFTLNQAKICNLIQASLYTPPGLDYDKTYAIHVKIMNSIAKLSQNLLKIVILAEDMRIPGLICQTNKSKTLYIYNNMYYALNIISMQTK